MRIISGKLGGRKIQPPASMPHTRPTTDRAKEGLFNIIENNLDIGSLTVLDLFGGTGSISYELASRGAIHCTVVENDPKMHAFIKQTAEKLELPLTVVKDDVFRFIASCHNRFGFIFAGPPYALTRIDDLPRMVFEHRLLEPGGWFVLEHTPRNDYKKFPGFKAERNYGTTLFSIFVQDAEPA
ncbi:MAG: RsmD family RNA methyltransferase [Dinghuibacter sp.]|nr:RsmD family RNA methyltransferase [Dinghuibacter sp.]